MLHDGKSAETRHLRPGEVSTGTTIMAVAFDGGVVLGEFLGSSLLYLVVAGSPGFIPITFT